MILLKYRWLIYAIGFGFKIITRCLVGPGSATTTDYLVLTDATFPLDAGQVSEVAKDTGV
jgi:hypothetical protein